MTVFHKFVRDQLDPAVFSRLLSLPGSAGFLDLDSFYSLNFDICAGINFSIRDGDGMRAIDLLFYLWYDFSTDQIEAIEVFPFIAPLVGIKMGEQKHFGHSWFS